LAHFNEVTKNATILTDVIAKIKETPGSKSGELVVNVVLLNNAMATMCFILTHQCPANCAASIRSLC